MVTQILRLGIEFFKIPNFPGYSIATTGEIYSHKTHKILKTRDDKNKYQMISLRQDGKTITLKQHRIVAMTFISNPENKAEVNHIDGNKSNNCVENLEWATHQENITHCTEVLGTIGRPKLTI